MQRSVLSLKPKAAVVDEQTWFGKTELVQMSNNWQKIKGRLVYEPNRGSDFRKTFKAKTLVLELPNDQLDLYYQWFLEKKFGSWYKTQRPMFGLHVTVVRGDEKVKNAAAWKKHAGEEIVVEYNPVELRKKWQFWSMPVRSSRLEQLRAELGLSAFHDFHVTVARLHDWQRETEKK